MKIIFIFLLTVMMQILLAGEIPAGHPSVKDVLDAKGETPGNKPALPLNVGIVVNTIHSNNYTYIELKNEQKNIWLAAPKVELADNTRIRYGRGITMVNFYSNGLKREFPEIYFVERVEIAE